MQKIISLVLLLSISATLAACSGFSFYQPQSPAPEDVVTHKDR